MIPRKFTIWLHSTDKCLAGAEVILPVRVRLYKDNIEVLKESSR